MRILVAIGILLAGISAAVAQQQENKLMDRLLRPDVTLVNSAQNKKFANTPTATFDKPAQTRTFSAVRKPAEKTFSNQRALTPQQIPAPQFRGGDSAANISTGTQVTKNDKVFATSAATAGTLAAPENNETVPVREYAGTRPFLGKGKSQKALSAQDKPLTIEQVRELLNKSK